MNYTVGIQSCKVSCNLSREKILELGKHAPYFRYIEFPLEKKMIRVYEPFISKNQNEYVMNALVNNELSYHGRYEKQFEKKLQEYLKVKHVILTANGTVSLFAAYQKVFFSNPKCFVITPTVTYASTVNQIKLAGYTPLYIDCDENFQLDLNQLEAASKYSGVSGLVVANLYADSPNMNSVMEISRKANIPVVEDAAEAFGCWKDGKAIGTFGDVGSFSFFANKIITTGEGGCLVTDNDELASKLRKFTTCNTPGGYRHDGLGANYRMAHLQAALGCGQLEDVEEILTKKRNIAKFYRDNLKFQAIIPKWVDTSSEWLPVFKLQSNTYQEFREHCHFGGVEVRPTFYPLHEMPEFDGYCPYPLTNALNSKDHFFIPPAGPNLTQEQLDTVVKVINEY